jgi:hypothetical protein
VHFWFSIFCISGIPYPIRVVLTLQIQRLFDLRFRTFFDVVSTSVMRRRFDVEKMTSFRRRYREVITTSIVWRRFDLHFRTFFDVVSTSLGDAESTLKWRRLAYWVTTAFIYIRMWLFWMRLWTHGFSKRKQNILLRFISEVVSQ